MTKKCYILCVVLFVLFLAIVVLLIRESHAEVHHVEKFYQEKTCPLLSGAMEVVTDSGTRCDCLTNEFAIEYDFGHKYAESIGQSINYGLHFHRRPGIVLILENSYDEHFLQELLWENQQANLGIKIWSLDQNLVLKQEN